MTAREFYLHFIAVRKCAGCGEILDPSHAEGALCEKCRVLWNEATLVGCGDCFKPARECCCMPKLISDAGALCLRKLFFYRSDAAYTPAMGVLYTHKNKKLARVTDFVADRISDAVADELGTIAPVNRSERVAVTFVPRRKRSRRLYGFDQSELLARAISQRLDMDFAKTFDTRFFSVAQKDLASRQRLSNARKNIYLESAERIKGKYVVLIDDVVTTGASMSVCVKRLMDAGAVGVLCFCIAFNSAKSKK